MHVQLFADCYEADKSDYALKLPTCHAAWLLLPDKAALYRWPSRMTACSNTTVASLSAVQLVAALVCIHCTLRSERQL